MTDPDVVVYWRGGCFYCNRLLRALRRAGVPVIERDIWSDDAAREFVRQHNGGDETVPTVVVGAWVRTNPEPAELLDHLRREYPALVAAEPPTGLLARLRPHWD